MSATRDLIAAALSLADIDDECTGFPTRTAAEAREMCARAMSDVPEADFGNMLDCRTCAHFTADGCHSTATCIDAQQYKATAPRQYWTSAQQRASDADMQVYQAIAGGYARDTQRVSAAEVPMQCGWYQDGDEESTTWQTSCNAYFTLNEGTPSDNRFSFCYSCGKHIVEYPIDEDAALRGEVKP